MVSQLRRRRLSVSSLPFAGRARRFRCAGDPGTAVARPLSGRVRRRDVAREYEARTAQESLRRKLTGSGRAFGATPSSVEGGGPSPVSLALDTLSPRAAPRERGDPAPTLILPRLRGGNGRGLGE